MTNPRERALRIIRVGRVAGAFAVGGLIAFAACNACGRKGDGADPNLAPGEPSAARAVHVNRTTAPNDAGAAVVRAVAMWSAAREGQVEDLATLATHEGAAGLVEAAAEAELRVTALRAMGYARGWAQLPYLAQTALGPDDDEARIALVSSAELGARPRRSEDVEDEAELREGCEKLGALARDTARARDRRVLSLRALRMIPCPKQDLPTDLDAR